MPLPSLAELERRCQKLDHQRLGNWMARRVSRPLALRVTRVVLPLGISAHAVTLAAWSVGAVGAIALASGNPGGWLAGAIFLQVWYLLDHVDGQIARYRGTASLDGVALDYLMHHTMNLLVPLGVGFGVAHARGQPLWLAAGVAWGLSLQVLGQVYDTRYKAFIQRLKLVQGTLHVQGGGGFRPTPPSPPPRSPWRLAIWVARKSCEMHVIMNVLSLLAGVQFLLADARLSCGCTYLALTAPLAALLAAATVYRSSRGEAAEREFSAWYQPPPGSHLQMEEGWWRVVPWQAAESDSPSRLKNTEIVQPACKRRIGG